MTGAIQRFNQDIKNEFLQIMSNENYPMSVRDGISQVMELVNSNKTIVDLYPMILQEIPMSQSLFQDCAVQFEEHHTPHRKLKQVMLELDGKLGALDAARNGGKKIMIKIRRLKAEITDLERIYNNINEDQKIIIDDYLVLQIHFPMLFSESTVSMIRNDGLTNSSFINSVLDKIQNKGGDKLVELEESERAQKSNQHMIKDAAIKAHQLQLMADKYQREVEESGLSFDESEFVYYTMFFTAEAERQLRTGDHQIDRGTYMAISQLPDAIRKKVQWNVSYIRKKLFEDGYPIDGDYLFRTDREVLVPKKTGPMEFEGLNVQEYLMVEPIKLIARDKKE